MNWLGRKGFAAPSEKVLWTISRGKRPERKRRAGDPYKGLREWKWLCTRLTGHRSWPVFPDKFGYWGHICGNRPNSLRFPAEFAIFELWEAVSPRNLTGKYQARIRS